MLGFIVGVAVFVVFGKVIKSLLKGVITLGLILLAANFIISTLGGSLPQMLSQVIAIL